MTSIQQQPSTVRKGGGITTTTTSKDGNEYRPVMVAMNAPVDVKVMMEQFTTPNKFMATRVISHASGSAICEIGNTKVMCAVYGPRAPQTGGRAEFYGKGTLDVSVEMATFGTGTRTTTELPHFTRTLSQDVFTALESCVRLDTFPKSVLDVVLLILQDDGSLLPACIACACLATADAGIEMYDLVSSCTVMCGSSNNNTNNAFVVNPNKALENQPGSILATVTLSASRKQIAGFNWHGNVLRQDNDEARKLAPRVLEHGFTACMEMDALMRQVLMATAAI